MALRTTTDVAEIKALLAAALADDPIANTVYSSVLSGLERDGAAGWAAYQADDPLVLAARSQAHTPIALTSNWQNVTDVAAAIAALDPPAAAVAAEPTVIDALVAGIGRAPRSRTDERLFRLDELVPPTGVEGRGMRATSGDAELLRQWLLDFGEEAFGHRESDEFARDQIERGLTFGTCWLWTVGDSAASFAYRHAAVDGVARIGPVYTPPALRRHGYGSAVTAAAARQILDQGAVPCLYTDLANPTSNKIYQALGFRPVLDRCAVTF
jgi:GNAT superfamily N-acetyltransferase